ncbi:MAG: hypothetical protein U5J78_01205 [Parasphingorhabdus sp.]|nr:hypothetical protein [Parasphingorhabdus sp.]
MNGQENPPLPIAPIHVAVTGHRATHPEYGPNAAAIENSLAAIFAQINAVRGANVGKHPVRLHTLFTDGTDQVAARLAVALEWELRVPLPFGAALNAAINASPLDAENARAILAGVPAPDANTQSRVDAIQGLASQALRLELADQDARIARLFLAMHDAPQDGGRAQAFVRESAQRAALAARILIEQSDLLIAVWDGDSIANLGGAGHTVSVALAMGSPVVLIDPSAPAQWHILRAPEALAVRNNPAHNPDRDDELQQLVRAIIQPAAHGQKRRWMPIIWRSSSSFFGHGYRRIEALFGGEGRRLRGLKQHYELPSQIASGSGAPLLSVVEKLPGGDPALADRIGHAVLRRFAWADGISANLSDRYRGGMTINFILSALAVSGGIAYLPLVPVSQKWGFALIEFLLLVAIISITWVGQKRRWHGRWFETRRVAEYLRHSPLTLALGVARPPGRWPRGTETSWPELYARRSLREVGLPRTIITSSYLRQMLQALTRLHVLPQRDYHFAKAKRLKTVHHNLDLLSESMFLLAVVTVAIYLLMVVGSALSMLDRQMVEHNAKLFTLLGVLFPTFGGAIAGIRFFGDFERFAAISEVTAEKLDSIHHRAALPSCSMRPTKWSFPRLKTGKRCLAASRLPCLSDYDAERIESFGKKIVQYALIAVMTGRGEPFGSSKYRGQ